MWEHEEKLLKYCKHLLLLFSLVIIFIIVNFIFLLHFFWHPNFKKKMQISRVVSNKCKDYDYRTETFVQQQQKRNLHSEMGINPQNKIIYVAKATTQLDGALKSSSSLLSK